MRFGHSLFSPMLYLNSFPCPFLHGKKLDQKWYFSCLAWEYQEAKRIHSYCGFQKILSSAKDSRELFQIPSHWSLLFCKKRWIDSLLLCFPIPQCFPCQEGHTGCLFKAEAIWAVSWMFAPTIKRMGVQMTWWEMRVTVTYGHLAAAQWQMMECQHTDCNWHSCSWYDENMKKATSV